MYFKISICILYYSSLYSFNIETKKGVIISYHGYIQVNVNRTSGSKTAAIVRNKDLGCPVCCFEFSKWMILSYKTPKYFLCMCV